MKRVSVPERGVEALFGNHDENLRFLEETQKVRIRSQPDALVVEGDPGGEDVVEQVFVQLAGLMKDGYSLSPGDVRLAAQLLAQDTHAQLRDYLMRSSVRGGKKTVVPRSLNQRTYLEQIETHDMVFGIGPAGTGKTYLAVAQAVASLMSKAVSRIVLARPAVEAGEKLGFLPGDLQDKVDPYLRPLYDALYDLLDYEKVARLLERSAIEVAPIAFMRGRTLNDAFVIVDEAQNTTTEQMKMVLTRVGFGSKLVVNGDITQIDLPQGKISGLVEAIAVLGGVKGISFVYFDERDVVRHKLVQAVIKAYDAYGAGQAPAK
jgi:phosphate starvation-inducible protein PhoH and related proteins